MAHFFGYKRWEVDELTNEEVSMYLRELPFVRYIRDFAIIRYAFSKLGEDDRKKMLEPETGPDDIATRAWKKYTEPYEGTQTLEPAAQPLAIHPVTAEAIVTWVEKGELSLSPYGADVWRDHVFPMWQRLLATTRLQSGA